MAMNVIKYNGKSACMCALLLSGIFCLACMLGQRYKSQIKALSDILLSFDNMLHLHSIRSISGRLHPYPSLISTHKTRFQLGLAERAF
jgi:hypothetical protein